MGTCFRCGAAVPFGKRLCEKCRAPSRRKLRGEINMPLTFREKQVVKLVYEGLRNKEIAARLHLTEGTIKEYLNRIFRKTQVSTRTQLAIWYMAHA